MIRYNSREVSDKLFCQEPGVLWNNRFFLTSQFSFCRIFVLYKWQGRLFTSLNIFSPPFYLFENFVFSAKPPGLFLTFVLILSSGDCNVDISEQLLYQVKDLVHDSSSLACRNSYCVHHNVSNSLFPLTAFGRESCLKVMLSFVIKHALWDTTISSCSNAG